MSDVIAMFAGPMPEFYRRYLVPMDFAPHARALTASDGEVAISNPAILVTVVRPDT